MSALWLRRDLGAPRRCRRPRRVAVLLAGIAALSVADLAVTLTHLQTVGMMEANPIADFLLRWTSSAWPLASFKLGSLGICLGLLYRLRDRRSAEAAAWVGLGVLLVVSVLWDEYGRTMRHPETAQRARLDERRGWMVVDDEMLQLRPVMRRAASPRPQEQRVAAR